MAFFNFMTFIVLKILDNSNSNTCLCKQNFENCTRHLNFTLNVLSEYSISFSQFLIFLAKKNVVNFQSDFYRKRGCVTILNYLGTCKGICSYNLVYNFLVQLLRLQSSVSVVDFSNAFWHENNAYPKGSSQNEIVLLLAIFHLPQS